MFRTGGLSRRLNCLICRPLRSISTLNTLQQRVFLMGSPGCGKTTVGGILASRLGWKAIDIDNDFLEHHWDTSVANKLEEVGGEGFIEAEGQAVLHFFAPDKTVISLTGSNPMHDKAMSHISGQGTVVFLDVQATDILKRLQNMKVDRIVGQTDKLSMSDILDFRQQFYEGNYDIRIICEPAEAPESIANRVSSAIDKYNNPQSYVSTRGSAENTDFNDVILRGLAPDGGLYVPGENIPSMSIKEWSRLINLTYQERGLRILEKWIHPSSLHPRNLNSMISEAYDPSKFKSTKVFPVVHLHDNVYTTELFHGPTASFKDAALQLMPSFFHSAFEDRVKQGILPGDTKFLILVATSGDTGSAVLYGFNRLAQMPDSPIRVMVSYPEEGVSAIQKHQMTSLPGKGVRVVGVKSDFDFCQTAIKKIFNDSSLTEDFKRQTGFSLSAANSINWGRLLPQVVYHASTYLDLVQRGVVAMGDEVDLCIPTGNFGNILAAYYAKEMGIPFRRLVCASNVNNVLTEFFHAGCYDLRNRSLHVTASPAIDILKSSNLERYLYNVTGNDSTFVRNCYNDLNNKQYFQVPADLVTAMQKTFVADWCSEEASLQTIAETYNKTGYILDPHTAVAKCVADRVNRNDIPMVIAGTAHYAKFGSDVLEALGQSQRSFSRMGPVELFAELESLRAKPHMQDTLRRSIQNPTVHKMVIEANDNAVIKEVRNFLLS